MNHQPYIYLKQTYCITYPAYQNLVTLARRSNFVRSQYTAKGLSNFLNSITLEPTFTTDDLEAIAAFWALGMTNHEVHLNQDDYHQPNHYKLALAPEQVEYFSNIGKTYKLWRLRKTPTALTSNVLEALGNGKFKHAVTHSTPLPSLKSTYRASTVVIEVTSRHNRWINEMARQCGYEPEIGYRKDPTQRGILNFIKDFCHIPLIPYNSQTHDAMLFIPPKRLPTEPVTVATWRTTPQLQQILDHILYAPHLPWWPTTQPDGLNFEASRSKQLKELQDVPT